MNTRPAFTLLDLVACIGLAAVVSAVGVPAVRTAASDNSLQRCRYNYRFISQASAMYQEDFGGRMWALSWTAGMTNPDLPISPVKVNVFATDIEAHTTQAYLLARKLHGLTRVNLPVSYNYFTEDRMAHLALADYAGVPITASSPFVCPSDGPRLELLRVGRDAWPYSDVPMQSMNWFGTSYVTTAYHVTPSRQTTVLVNGVSTPMPMFYWQSYTSGPFYDGDATKPFPPGALGPQLASGVSFPSSKVFLADYYSRHNGPARYFAYSDVTNDLLFYDGSLRNYRTDFTNPGWDPRSASSRQTMETRFPISRTADYWGGLDGGKTSQSFVAGWYRWTRGGLFGWDVPRATYRAGKPPERNLKEVELNTQGGW